MKICKHENTYRMSLKFEDEIRERMISEGHWAPYTHQVFWCCDCSEVVGQEDNSERKLY